MTTDPFPPLDDECFFIAPIGEEGSDVRNRSDGILEYIVEPASQELGLTTIRADKIAKPGEITRQVIEHVVGARAAVVDLTGANPNVYYEMAVRHTAQLPTVLIAQDGENLPFDIAQMRTIFFDHTNLKSANDCRVQISRYLREAMSGEVDSPISTSVRVQKLEQGSAQDRVLAQIVDGLDVLRTEMGRLTGPAAPNLGEPDQVSVHAEAIEDAARIVIEGAERDLLMRDSLPDLERPIAYMLRRAHEQRSDLSRRYRSSISELRDDLDRTARLSARGHIDVPDSPGDGGVDEAA